MHANQPDIDPVKKFKAKCRENGICEWCYKNPAEPGITRCLQCALGESYEPYMAGDIVEAMYPLGTHPPQVYERYPSLKASKGAPSRARVIAKIKT